MFFVLLPIKYFDSSETLSPLLQGEFILIWWTSEHVTVRKLFHRSYRIGSLNSHQFVTFKVLYRQKEQTLYAKLGICY